MNILEPELVWVDGRCYRFFDSNVWSSEETFSPYFEEYNQKDDDIANETMDLNVIQIDKTNDGKYKHCVLVPKLLHRFIIGFEGGIKRKLESETHTVIKIPKIDVNDQIVEIIGSNKSEVISCRQRIDLLIESSKDKVPFTHFLAIPLNDEEIINNFNKFKEEILNNPEISQNIQEDYFVSAQKLHLTIGMLKLLDDKDKCKAIDTLNGCVEEVIKPLLNKHKMIQIVIQGLEIMNDDPTKIRVLYAEVVNNDKLQELVDKIFEYFVDKGIMSVQYTNKVKLHMTLMKTSRLNKRYKGHSRTSTFSGAKIITKYKNYYFGQSQLKTINIAERTEVEIKNAFYNKLVDINLYN
ncbi:activating signal cointegrator 1 complex subunit 1 [Chelonus insularis]|uniref:activating signal cointegrator 1 complex subunit 1 n=1 Tax=Chelonus insularis TaxID=460826 RepID=UPI00158F05D2|nr:activating signal cointegrator 1 complex subunit 1 [Chelonus insularis]XP_034949766.1 activating signal cointegrator 1 complex subunit 1 [Chelonus insularis]